MHWEKKTIPGRFVGQTDQLDIHLDYFCRAFIVTAGETTFGNVLPFRTLTPQAVDFNPKEGTQNTNMLVEGRNLTADTKVLWNDMVIVPDNITAESLVEFKAPALSGNPLATIRLVAQGDTATINDPFEYIIGQWNEEGPVNLPTKNMRHVYFEDGDQFIYGLGIISSEVTRDVYVLDINSFQRTNLSFPGTPVQGAFFDKKYFGGGSINNTIFNGVQLNLSSEFWKYENQDFIQLQDMPVPLYRAVCLVVGDRLYLYGGEIENRQRNLAIYTYDIDQDTWSPLSFAPISPLNSLPAFNLGDYNYFVTENGTTYRHDYLNDEWEVVADFPIDPQDYGVSLTLNGQAYVGAQGSDRRMYTYRPADNTWRTKTSIPVLMPFTTGGGWADNDKIYVIRAEDSGGLNTVYWSLAPEAF